MLDMNYSSPMQLDGMNSFSRFNLFNDGYKVYTTADSSAPVKESESGASEIFLEKYDGSADKEAATHYIEADFGRLYVISDSICYYEAKNNAILTIEDGYYSLYGASFEDIIN